MIKVYTGFQNLSIDFFDFFKGKALQRYRGFGKLPNKQNPRPARKRQDRD